MGKEHLFDLMSVFDITVLVLLLLLVLVRVTEEEWIDSTKT